MGMHLMASQNPRFLGGVGEAGLSTAAMQAAQNKEESERAYKEALAKHYGVDPMIQRLNALKDPETAKMYAKMKEMEREPMTKEKLYTSFMSSPAAMGLMGDPGKLNDAFKAYVNSYEENFGRIGGLPSGVRVSRS
jgi:hypothetical protein